MNKHQGWHGIGSIVTQKYTCSYCSQLVASKEGWRGTEIIAGRATEVYLCICPNCYNPTYRSIIQGQIPSPKFGTPIQHIPEVKISALYEEARSCYSHNAYTASVMCCRKLLMHVAVQEGAKEDQSFKFYVDYLLENSLPPKAKDWVDLIRDKGNFANHEIELMNQSDAEHLIRFSEMLLKNIYEFPALATNFTQSNPSSP